RRLHLDHVGAEDAEREGAVRRADALPALHHGHAGQRQRHVALLTSPPDAPSLGVVPITPSLSSASMVASSSPSTPPRIWRLCCPRRGVGIRVWSGVSDMRYGRP